VVHHQISISNTQRDLFIYFSIFYAAPKPLQELKETFKEKLKILFSYQKIHLRRKFSLMMQ
jgi:hypothetical protein